MQDKYSNKIAIDKNKSQILSNGGTSPEPLFQNNKSKSEILTPYCNKDDDSDSDDDFKRFGSFKGFKDKDAENLKQWGKECSQKCKHQHKNQKQNNVNKSNNLFIG